MFFRQARSVPLLLILLLAILIVPMPRHDHTRSPRVSEEAMFAAEKRVGSLTAIDALAQVVPSETQSDGSFVWESRAVSNQSDYGEPSIDLDHKGGIYVVAPGGLGVQMWKSFDKGATFDYQEIASTNGGGDSEIEFNLNDVGFTADLELSDSMVTRSPDRFTEVMDQQEVGVEQDRQWLGHRCNKHIYLVYHDLSIEAEVMNQSRDGGKTWDMAPTPIGPSGSAPGDQDADIATDTGVNTFSGPVAVNQKNGDIYVVYAISTTEGNVTTGVPPFGQPQQIVVGVSHDKGASFELHLVQGGENGALAGLLFPWITIDKAGNVYVSYARRDTETDPINIEIRYSKDRGDTWSDPYVVNTDRTGHAHIYSTISAGDTGVVDVAWYTSSTPDPASPDNDWFVDFAQVRSANTGSPDIKQSRVYSETIHHGDICLNGTLCAVGGDRSLLDFFQVQVGKDGMANIAFANNGSPDTTQRIWYSRQTSGPSAGNPMHDMQYCGASTGTGGGTKLPGPQVHFRVSNPRPPRNATVRMTTRLGQCPGHEGTRVELRQKKQGHFVVIQSKRVNDSCRAVFKVVASFDRGVFKATWPKQDNDHRRGRSESRTVTTH